MNDYKGKKISILGDSISTLENYIPEGAAVYYDAIKAKETDVNEFEDTWWGMLINELGADLLINESYSGSMIVQAFGVMAYPSASSNIRLNNLGRDGNDPDIVIIFMGTNDYYNGAKLYDEKKNNLESFDNAYRFVIETINRKYNNPEIWLMNLPMTTNVNDPLYVYPESFDNRYLREYNKVIKDIAKDYNLKLINLFKSGKYESIDGSHPNRQGMEDIFNMIMKNLE